MAIIGKRKCSAVVSAKEWEFLRYPLLVEERKECPRWKLEADIKKKEKRT